MAQPKIGSRHMMPVHDASELAELFQEGKRTIEKRDFETAKNKYQRIIEIDKECAEAWNNLGLALCELDQYRESIEAYSHISEEQRTDKTWYNIALAHYYSRDYDDALSCIQNILRKDSYNSIALDLKGKVHLEQEDYQNAMTCFNQGFTIDGDPKFLLWEAYALYMFSEFSRDVDEKMQRKLLNTLIGRLERLEALAVKHKRKEIREQTLYYLGCCYSRYKDYSTAIKKLEECLNESRDSKVSRAARNLLGQTWNQIRPAFWIWWLQSPLFLSRSIKRIIFIFTFILMVSIIVLLLIHPLWPSLHLQADSGVYLFLAGLFLIVLLYPSVEQIKAKDLEIKMHAPPPLDPFPAPAMMEGYIGSLSHRGKLV
jgi:tetratricopeptide (TPR) repeat protein